MNDSELLRRQKNALVKQYSARSNLKAYIQIVVTLFPFFFLLYISSHSFYENPWLALIACTIWIFFVLRVFVMMHDCGHGCLFNHSAPNRIVGFVLGVLCGVPQYVWSKHHDYHHATNGNWQKYQGPLSVLSSTEYLNLDAKGKKAYKNNRNILLAPFGGFLYFIFNPRFTFFKGTLDCCIHLVKQKWQHPHLSISSHVQTFKTQYWNTWREYAHMAANNIVLLLSWTAASYYFGVIEFFTVYIIGLSVAGGIGIILFTVQHNFEGSYAAGDKGWNYFTAALQGTSYLKLPLVLQWFTANIGYHHIHHLSARIPSYNLVQCHNENHSLFKGVKRLTIRDIPAAFKHIIWDEEKQQLISIEQCEQQNDLNLRNAKQVMN